MVILVIIYYREKFSLIFSNPKGFIDLFLNISRIASFSLYALALNMGIFLLAAIVEIIYGAGHYLFLIYMTCLFYCFPLVYSMGQRAL